MYYSKLVTTLFMLVVLATRASEPTIKLTWSAQYQLPKKHMDLGFLGNMNDGFLQIGHDQGQSMSLQKFSPALKLTSTKMIDLKSMPKSYDVEKFIEWNGKYYWLYTTWTKSESKERLFIQQIDITKGALTGSAKELIACGKVTGDLVATGFYQMHKTNKFKIHFGNDSTKMFVYVVYPNESRNDAKNKMKYGFWVFDSDLKQVWSKPEVYMPYTEKKMDVKDMTVDHEGNFLFLGRVFNDDTEKEIVNDVPNFHFEIMKFSANSTKATTIPFQFEDKFVSQITIFQDKKNNVVCAGFYSGREKNGKLKNIGGKVDGSFFMRLDGDKLQNVHKGFYEIPAEVFKEYEKQKTQRKLEAKEEKGENNSAFNMRLRDVVFNEDGSLLLLGEEYYYITYTYTSGRSTYTRTTYYYLDILAQYIDASGNMSWTKKIPKNQVGSNSTYGLGFRVVPYNGDSYLFFLDNEKNLNITPDRVPERHAAGWNGVLMGVKLDAAGTLKKVKVLDTKTVNQRLDIIDADEVSDNMLITRSSVGANSANNFSFRYFSDSEPSKACLIEIK
ncbi:MAG TPA: hypothetical protein VK154_09270 [Chitinophagales bacterium]|nr:hypothetical protein [Chitinophagales bacterium]